jgi:hypothetical protein
MLLSFDMPLSLPFGATILLPVLLFWPVLCGTLMVSTFGDFDEVSKSFPLVLLPGLGLSVDPD